MISVDACKLKRREANREASRRYRENNRERFNENQKRYRERNRELCAERVMAWRKDNRDVYNALAARYRAAKRHAHVAWTNKRDVEVFYSFAQAMTELTGSEYQVDHIVPLVSSVVCGLHTEANLQVILASVNRQKSNTF